MDFYHRKSSKILVFGCNLCRIACPTNTKVSKGNSIEAYACWSLDENDRKSSSSGGIASIFYAHFINNKSGICYGCSYNENLKLIFSRVSQIEDLQKFKTSKYSFSFIGNTFKNIKKDLQENLQVIFIGTPCQVAGLKNYLNKNYDNLLCIDLICHGMPPQQYLDEYINGLNLQEKPDNISFRGLNDFKLTLYSKNKIIYCKDSSEDKYYKAFLNGLFYRENCYTCSYANSQRVGDITIGDFWGLGNNIPFNYDKKNGVSLVLINNNKGKNYFDEIKDKIFYEKRTIQEAILGNEQLRVPSKMHPKHQEFIELYSKYGIHYSLNTLI